MSAKILVVDDQEGPRESLRMILNHEHEVRTASGGSEALRMIREDQPDLVFLDIRMPEMDGTEVLRRIKEIAPDCQVAMITAYAAVKSAQRAIRLGALDYITKPFGVTEIEEVVERTLARRREQKEGRMLLEQLSSTISQLSEEISHGPDQPSGSDDALARGLATAHSSIEDQLNEVLRLSSIGEVAAEVAHDMNNFLSTILFRIEVMLLDLDQAQQVDPQTLADGLQQIALAARDGGEALDRISTLSRENPYDPLEEVDLNAVLRDAVGLSRGRAEGDSAEPIYDLAELPAIQGSPAGLRAVFTNLIINAYHAISDADNGGSLTIRTRAEEGRVVARIIDEGSGMDEEVLSHLHEPFFTTKGEGGTGLGLTVAYKVINQHRGSIEFESAPGEGTTVTVTLPIRQQQEVEPATETAVPVLIVDDQESMLLVTREVLESDGHRILTASSPSDAIRLFQECIANPELAVPAVLITDLRMPEMSGIELAGYIKELAPRTAIILLSAFVDEVPQEALEIAAVAMEKPCNLRELSAIVTDLIDSRETR